MNLPGKRGYICKRCGVTRRALNPHAINAESAEWPRCCEENMTLMGHRQAQAAALLKSEERLQWIQMGALIMKGQGKRKWRPIMSENHKQYAYPAP